MNLKPIILAMAAAASSTAADAQINSKQSGGYAARAAAMFVDGNYRGCIDQCEAALELGNPQREELSWLKAVAAFKEGDKRSRGLLTSFIKQFPSASQRHTARLLLATITLYDGDYAKALTELNSISRNSLQPGEVDDLDYRRAFCMIKVGELSQARELMTGLSHTKRYGNAAEFYLGYISYVEGNYDDAAELFARCDTSAEPADMAPYYLAQIQFHRGRYDEAFATATSLLQRTGIDDEYHDEAQRICGESLYAIGREPQSLAYLLAYVDKHPDDAPLSTRYIVGLDSYEKGEYERAVELLAPVSELTDAMGQSAALTIGQCYLALGNTAQALMQFEKAARLDFDSHVTEMAYYNYAVARVDGGRIPFGNSVGTLEEFIKRYPRSTYAAKVQDYLVKGYMSTDDYDGALRSLNSLKGNNSPLVLDARQQVNFVLGTRALQALDAPLAESYLKEARKFSDRNADISRQTTLWLGDAFYAQGNYAEAQKEYENFLKYAPSGDVNRPLAQYNLAYALFAQKDYENARKRFQSAHSSGRLDADALIDCLNRIADTYYYSKEFSKALQTYRRAFDASPASGDYSLLQIAAMNGHLGQYGEKIKILDRLISDYPNSSLRPTAMTEKALSQASGGNAADAIATYERVIASYPATAQGRNAMLQLAILQRNAGNVERAKDYYRMVISSYPSSAEAALAVQDLKVIYGNDGNIDELNDFLIATDGAPQLDAVERNAIAAAGLLRSARSAVSSQARLAAALELLEKYPEADGAEEAMLIAARAEYDQGLADKALTRFLQLEERASSASMHHSARMGILRAARDMGDYDRVLATSSHVLGSSAMAGADIQEVKFIRAEACTAKGNSTEAMKLWQELAKTPVNIYGCRSAYEIADTQFKAGQLASAAKSAEDLIDANPPHPYWLARTFILYSDILRAQDKGFEADEYLKALRSNYPGTDADIFQMIDKRLPKQ